MEGAAPPAAARSSTCLSAHERGVSPPSVNLSAARGSLTKLMAAALSEPAELINLNDQVGLQMGLQGHPLSLCLSDECMLWLFYFSESFCLMSLLEGRWVGFMGQPKPCSVTSPSRQMGSCRGEGAQDANASVRLQRVSSVMVQVVFSPSPPTPRLLGEPSYIAS